MLISQFLHAVYVPSRIELSPLSVRQIEITIRSLEAWAGHPIQMRDLTEDLVRRYLAELRKSRSGATVNSKRCQLLALWRCAYEEEEHDRPPRVSKIPRAKASPTIPEAWTPEEVGRIIRAANRTRAPIAGIPSADWFVSLLLVLYDTGERRGAVLATETRDVDLDAGHITFLSTKTGRPRLCALHCSTVAACRKIYDPARRLMWPLPISRESLEKRFRKILWRARVKFGKGHGGLFHKLRRTSGTLVEAAGGDGARHIGNTRKVFESNYLDPRFCRNNLDFLPRPE